MNGSFGRWLLDLESIPEGAGDLHLAWEHPWPAWLWVALLIGAGVLAVWSYAPPTGRRTARAGLARHVLDAVGEDLAELWRPGRHGFFDCGGDGSIGVAGRALRKAFGIPVPVTWSYAPLTGDRTARAVLAVGRFTVLLLVLVFIGGPMVELPRERLERDWVLMLADRSASMSIADVEDDGRRITRDEQLRGIINDNREVWAALAEQRQVQWLGFHSAAFSLVSEPGGADVPVPARLSVDLGEAAGERDPALQRRPNERPAGPGPAPASAGAGHQRVHGPAWIGRAIGRCGHQAR